MRILRKLCVPILLLAACLTPAMACMVAGAQTGAQMGAQERSCCHTMGKQCSQDAIPASRECCQLSTANLYDHALNTPTAKFHPVAVAALWLTASELVNPVALAAAWVGNRDYTPPKSPPLTVSILRI